jgi:tagatose-6-phosphate ketose/aldose isomerase
MTHDLQEERNRPSMTKEFVTHSEIFQQPELWEATVNDVHAADLSGVDTSVPVAVTGAGTSAYAAAAVAAGTQRGRAVASTDLLVDPTLLTDIGLLISLARSGDSPESVAVVQQTQRLQPAIRHLSITCNKDGRLANLPGVQSIVLDPRSNDRSLVMTSSFTNLVLAGLCLFHGDRLREEVPAIRARVTQNLPEMDSMAAVIAQDQPSRVVCLASSPLFPLAKEGALKLLEMTAGKIVPMAETFLGLRHGPMSFIEEDTLVVGFLSSDPTRRSYEIDLLRELKRKGIGRLVVVGSLTGSDAEGCTVVPAGAPKLPDFLRTPFEAPFAQLLGYQLSLRCDLNPDQPSPAGVISRVVGQFQIHRGEFVV